MDRIQRAFSARPSLKRQIDGCLNESPQYASLFAEISDYVNELRGSSSTDGAPATKKRKLDGTVSTSASAALNDPDAEVIYSASDVSFSLPARKKLTLQILKDGIRGVDPKTKNAMELVVAWKEIAQVFCLPVPEKQKRAWNFVVVPTANDGLSAAGEGAAEQIVWTFQELTAKETAAAGGGAPIEPHHTVGLLEQHLAPLGKGVIQPDEGEFASAVVQSHRKGEKAYHVKAFRGSKEGFLFFLSTGILWAFKKPLALFEFESVVRICYTNVLQRTFNLVITTQAGDDVEFSMLDQADFAGIDGYIKAHGMSDASLAKERAAKVYGVNKDKKAIGEANGQTVKGEQADDGLTDLQRAEQEIQDKEDEEEHDYDPGSDGDSDGSGSSGDDGDDDIGAAAAGDGEEADEDEDEENSDAGGAEEGDFDEEDGEMEEREVPPSFAAVNGHALGAIHPPDEPEGGFL